MAEESRIVSAASRLRGGQARLSDVAEWFDRGYFYTKTPADAPRLFVADLGMRGRWACVFSSPQRLANAVGECDYIGMPGADFLELTPGGVGLVFDPGEGYALALRADILAPAAATVRTRRKRHE
ncbi:SseB family protein [Saccharopolyspora phatthalungensis]|nr:SseB family protein [Saccharopolyspora phatthalungensis]